MKIRELTAKIVEIKNNSTIDGKIDKNKLYGQLSLLNVSEFGVVEKKQSFNYISWTIAEMVMKLIDPEANIEYLEPIRMEMIRFKIVFLGVEYIGEYPILDNANQGAVVEKGWKVKELKETVITQKKDKDGNIIGSEMVQTTRDEMYPHEELIFWQAGTRNADEGRKSRVTAMQINNSHQRALAKEVSRITGFGISIYTGEDLIQYG